MVASGARVNESLVGQLQEKFGLVQDPFSSDLRHFFKGAQRDHNLDSLRHLLHFSDMALLVTGEKGSGKTFILSELLREEADNIHSIIINASLSVSVEKFVLTLAGKVGVSAGKSENLDQVLTKIFLVTQQWLSEGKRTALLIDDVQGLSSDVAVKLLTSFSRCPVKEHGLLPVFSSSSTFVQKLSNDPEYSGFRSLIHQVQLKPFSKDDTENYVKICLLGAGAEKGLLLTEAQIDSLHRLGRGNPGRINRVAAGVLLGVDAPPKSFLTLLSENRQWVTIFAVSVVVLMLSLFLVSSLFYGEENGEVVVADSTPDKESEQVEETAILDLQRRIQDQEGRQESKGLSMGDEGYAGSGLPVISEVEGDLWSSDETQAVSKDTVESVSQIESEPVSQSDFGPVVDVDSIIVEETVQVGEPSKSATVVKTENAPISKVELSESVKVESAASEKKERVFSPLLEQFYRSLDTMLAESPTGSVVQLLGSYHEETAVKFIRTYDELGFFYVRSTYKGKPWFVVLDGPYDNKASARAFIKKYPKRIRSQSPWIRSVSGFR